MASIRREWYQGRKHPFIFALSSGKAPYKHYVQLEQFIQDKKSQGPLMSCANPVSCVGKSFLLRPPATIDAHRGSLLIRVQIARNEQLFVASKTRVLRKYGPMVKSTNVQGLLGRAKHNIRLPRSSKYRESQQDQNVPGRQLYPFLQYPVLVTVEDPPPQVHTMLPVLEFNDVHTAINK